MQSGSEYVGIVINTIEKAWASQNRMIEMAADMFRDAVERKNNIFIFGCSHAGIIAEETFYRSGGMVTVNPILFPGFMLNTRPITLTSKLERLEGLGKILVEENKLRSGDVLLIHSVSGRNTVPCEMAIEARNIGVSTVALTNVEYSKSVQSRHPGGKRLFELCDVVIDNCGVKGDAAVTLNGLAEPIGPTSTAVGAALVNALIIMTVEKLIADGVTPPVFLSANLEGGDEHNKKVLDEYKDNIFYM